MEDNRLYRIHSKIEWKLESAGYDGASMRELASARRPTKRTRALTGLFDGVKRGRRDEVFLFGVPEVE